MQDRQLPPLVVVTGGPFSGKTTMVRTLARRGYATVSEAAMHIIRGLNEKMGKAGQMSWRRAHLAEFQQMVLELQLEREGELEPGSGPVILDRGIADGIAYFRYFQKTPPDHLVRAAASRPYVHALVLETLSHFNERRSSGRTSCRADSLRLGKLLAQVYEELGVAVTWLDEAPLDRRLSRVERMLAELKNG